jgi:nitrite reductase/ring-hydroxylating ferredoxin subunit
MARRVEIAQESECPAGELVPTEVDGTPAVVARVGDSFYAFPDACPHRGYPLSKGIVRENTVLCALHGRTFDLRTGECLRPCGAEPLEGWDVVVDDGTVVVVSDDG